MGQEIEVRPGIITKDAEGRIKCIPIFSRIVSLLTEQNELMYAVPGGLIGVGLTVRRRGGVHATHTWPDSVQCAQCLSICMRPRPWSVNNDAVLTAGC